MHLSPSHGRRRRGLGLPRRKLLWDDPGFFFTIFIHLNWKQRRNEVGKFGNLNSLSPFKSSWRRPCPKLLKKIIARMFVQLFSSRIFCRHGTPFFGDGTATFCTAPAPAPAPNEMFRRLQLRLRLGEKFAGSGGSGSGSASLVYRLNVLPMAVYFFVVVKYGRRGAAYLKGRHNSDKGDVYLIYGEIPD